jgi:hypothetical protein
MKFFKKFNDALQGFMVKIDAIHRRCSSDGGGHAKLQELSGPTISQAYELTWEREYLDLTELARLRWVEGWKINKLSEHYKVSGTAIKERLRSCKNK